MSMVQRWANGSITKYGVMVRDPNIALPGDNDVLVTDFQAADADTDLAYRPQLIITVQ